ncbi:PEBP-like protein [Cubamyces sp. BRFM 1775]|nr:PEBP-like protein [Cubamyces sp. BRFM 1775]
MLIQVLLAIVFAVSITAQQNSTNVTVADVARAFTAAKIVPDVLPTFNPSSLLDVVFLDNMTGMSVDVTPGINLTEQQSAQRPQFFLVSNDTSLAGQTFVLVMVDPDAPTPQIRHLLAPGLMANGSLATGATLVNNTPAISEYISPAPLAGSGPHRYTMVLYIQPSNFTTAVSSVVNSSTPITNFNVSLFAQELGLGSPLAGNFFWTGPNASSTNSTGTNSTSNATSSGSSPASSNTTSASLGNEDLLFTATAFASVMFGVSVMSLV